MVVHRRNAASLQRGFGVVSYLDHDLAHSRAAVEQLERVGQLRKREDGADGGRAGEQAAADEHLVELGGEQVDAVREPDHVEAEHAACRSKGVEKLEIPAPRTAWPVAWGAAWSAVCRGLQRLPGCGASCA